MVSIFYFAQALACLDAYVVRYHVLTVKLNEVWSLQCYWYAILYPYLTISQHKPPETAHDIFSDKVPELTVIKLLFVACCSILRYLQYPQGTGRNVLIPCPVLAKVIQMDGTFKASYWSSCVSKSCTTTETKWLWLAGMSSHGETQVTRQGLYANRVNLTGNSPLEIDNVQVADATHYRCTAQRINYTSPRVYFVTIHVDSTGNYICIFIFVAILSLIYEALHPSDTSHPA